VQGSELRLEAVPVPGMPEIGPGTDLARTIAAAAQRSAIDICSRDVVVVAQKVVSKAEGRLRALGDVEPTEAAEAFASKLERDARFVQLVLDESTEVVRAERGVLIVRTRQGHVCANAGIDASNVPNNLFCLLPEDPDGSARRLRAELAKLVGAAPAIVISDSFGRPWRIGQTDVAIGCAGLEPIDDRRGAADAVGRELKATVTAVADEAAAAAGLVRAKEGREAVVVVRGLDRYITEPDGPGAKALLREAAEDLFRR
jgi:coenzyme F420-0:L-glutamate ligase / coenzyme F420-1:gamma-L-glutamate ligase